MIKNKAKKMKSKNPLKKLNQLVALANPIRFKILLALFISDVMKKKKNKNQKQGEEDKEE